MNSVCPDSADERREPFINDIGFSVFMKICYYFSGKPVMARRKTLGYPAMDNMNRSFSEIYT